MMKRPMLGRLAARPGLHAGRIVPAALLAAGMAVWGCSPVSSGPQEGWKEFRFRQLLTFRAPAAAQMSDERGIDSDYARWTAEGLSIQFDYGMFSDPLTSAPQNAVTVHEVVGGLNARIVSYQRSDGTFVSGAHFGDLGESRGGPRKKLTVTVESRRRVVPLEIIRSLRFR